MGVPDPQKEGGLLDSLYEWFGNGEEVTA